MCGRYVSPEERAIEQFFELHRIAPFVSCFNATPSMLLPVVRAVEGRLVAEPMQWGLIPGWWNRDELPTRTHNTRSEEAAGKPMWRAAVKNTRALVPAMGYYEWQGSSTPKQPYFMHRPDNGLFCFAGLWSQWRPPGGDPLLTYSILTTSASPAMSEVHHRMPVVLPREAWDAWLDPDQKDSAAALRLALESAYPTMPFHRVSLRVNATKNNDESLIVPVEEAVQVNLL